MATGDPIARAYAIIGVPRGASTRELKKQYKRLVRQWHPDRWQNDPVGQQEAALRMRAINDAYATLESLAPSEPVSKSASRPSPSAKAHRPLTKEELDAIVSAIGTESPIKGVVWVVIGVVSMAVAFFMIQPHRGADLRYEFPDAGTMTFAGILFASGLYVVAYYRTRK